MAAECTTADEYPSLRTLPDIEPKVPRPTLQEAGKCACGSWAAVFLIKSPMSKFQGLWLLRCAKEDPDRCRFWKVHGVKEAFGAPVEGTANYTCYCGIRAREQTVKKSGANTGRKFMTCFDNRCKFWEWAPKA